MPNQIYSVEVDRENQHGLEQKQDSFTLIQFDRPVNTTNDTPLPPVYDLFVDHKGVYGLPHQMDCIVDYALFGRG